MDIIIYLTFGLLLPLVLAPIFFQMGSFLQLWRVVYEKTALVYTLFGRVIGDIEQPGIIFPVSVFGAQVFLVPFFGKVYTVNTNIRQSYLRDQLVNSEEGAPMGVGIWYEMFINNPTAYLFNNSDPEASLRANVTTAVVKQLSNLKLDVLLENRNTLSKKVREDVSPTSTKWGFGLGSTDVRKVSFRDEGMIVEIQRKVVNRLRQVTAAMKQAGDNKVAIIRSEADKRAAQRLGEAQAVRPRIVGGALAEIQKNSDVANVLFQLLDIQATLRSNSKITIMPLTNKSDLLING